MNLLNKIFKKAPPQKIEVKIAEPKNYFYKERFYKTWSSKELNIIEQYIIKMHRKDLSINISKLQLKMPYRTISSIRCKVRERCAWLNVKYGTYTEE